MHEHRTTDGKTVYYMSRAELERLPGYRGSATSGRARCPIHGGDSHSAFQINWRTGWGHCFKCGDAWSLRVEDHPDTKLPKDHPGYQPGDTHRNTPPPTLESLAAARSMQKPPQNAPGSPQAGENPEMVSPHHEQARARLQAQIPAAMATLPGSPGAAYLESRGIDLETAHALQLGWMPNYPRWNAAGTKQRPTPSVVIPYTAPDGEIVGATGRAVNPNEKIRYYALPESRGYRPGLFNGRAISQAMRTGHPLLIVEGPLDAAAAYAAGYPLTVALGSTSYKRWEDFAGVERVILALDSDTAGIKARPGVYAALAAFVPDVQVLTPAAIKAMLEECKDLGEYWQRYRRMPPALGGVIMGPHHRTKSDKIGPGSRSDLPDPAPAPAHNPMNDRKAHARPAVDTPMNAGNPHDDPMDDCAMDDGVRHGCTAVDTPMQSGNPHASDSPRVFPSDIELTQAAVVDLFPQLDTALQLEAYELLERLQDRTFAITFRADFYAAYAVLTTPDRVACLWALIYHPADALARWRDTQRAA